MLQKLFYLLILPVATFLFCNFLMRYLLINTASSFSPLLYIFTLGVLAFPSALTSLIVSAVAGFTKLPLKRFLFFWISSCIIVFIPDSIYRTFPSLGAIFYFLPWACMGILAAGIAGMTLGRILLLIKNRLHRKSDTFSFSKLFFVKFLLLALIFSLFFTFLTGLFVNSDNLDQNTDPYHYYIHRGIPIAFSGIVRQEFSAPFPIISLPFFAEKLDADSFVKSIQLGKFLESWGLYLLIALLPAFAFTTITKTNKQYLTLLSLSFWILEVMFFLWGNVIV